jgi:RND family efflux transporter MFP subunit
VIRVGVTDRDIVRLRRGDTATVTFDAHPGEPIDARVADLAAAANPKSGTFDVELELEIADTEKQLLAGMVARVEIKAGPSQRLPVVPFAALTEGRGDRAFVFVADEAEERAHRVEISLAAVVGTDVVVAGGLEAGSLVVLDGSAYLQDQDAIEITGVVGAGDPQ